MPQTIRVTAAAVTGSSQIWPNPNVSINMGMAYPVPPVNVFTTLALMLYVVADSSLISNHVSPEVASPWTGCMSGKDGPSNLTVRDASRIPEPLYS